MQIILLSSASNSRNIIRNSRERIDILIAGLTIVDNEDRR
jgi:hypothetical protein